jgi:uncharacterized spore protein YtfJ
MTTQAAATPPDVPRSRTDEVLSTLAERLGATLTASSIFGTPVERDGITVIPVATLRLGFGGGSGTEPDRKQSGEGAGGGGFAVPTGYIEIRDGRSRFVRIARPARTAAMTLGAVLVGMTVIRLTRPVRS